MYKILRIKEPNYKAALFSEFNPRSTVRAVSPEPVETARKPDVAASSFQVEGAILLNSLPHLYATFHLFLVFVERCAGGVPFSMSIPSPLLLNR